jgi:hypothetical protein
MALTKIANSTTSFFFQESVHLSPLQLARKRVAQTDVQMSMGIILLTRRCGEMHQTHSSKINKQAELFQRNG